MTKIEMSEPTTVAKWPITLAAIRERRPCAPGWSTLLASLGYADGDFDPGRMVTLGDIAVSNGVADALWCARCLPVEAQRDLVRAILPAVERASMHTSDDRVHACIAVLRRWVDGQARYDGELRKAARAAEAAAWAATAKGAAARAAARAAEAAARAAEEAAWAAEAAAWAAEEAARAAAWAAKGAAAAAEAERARQVEDIVAVFGRLAIRPTLQSQAAAVREAVSSLSMIWGRHGGPDEAERRLAPLTAAADTLEWMEKHRAAVRALAEEAQRLQRDPLVAEVLARFGGEITGITEVRS